MLIKCRAFAMQWVQGIWIVFIRKSIQTRSMAKTNIGHLRGSFTPLSLLIFFTFAISLIRRAFLCFAPFFDLIRLQTFSKCKIITNIMRYDQINSFTFSIRQQCIWLHAFTNTAHNHVLRNDFSCSSSLRYIVYLASTFLD